MHAVVCTGLLLNSLTPDWEICRERSSESLACQSSGLSLTGLMSLNMDELERTVCTPYSANILCQLKKWH